MKRWSPNLSPTIALSLTVLWLVLNQTLSPGHILLGMALGTALAWGSSTLRPLRAQVRRLDVAAALLLVVLYDILRSNIAVARIVLGLVRDREVKAGFLRIPLDLHDPHGLATLAAIITSTPGTVWVGVSGDGKHLTLHVLDLRDESEWIHTIKGRYESRLLRIFQ